MSDTKELFDVAIIGCGPRGLSALEALFAAASKTKITPKVLVIEPATYAGAGTIYDLDQSDSNWLNVAERAIGIPPREKCSFKNFNVPTFADYQHWSGYTSKNVTISDIDQFPLRSSLGKYLNERFNSIAHILKEQGLLTFIKGEVDLIAIEDNFIKVRIIGGQLCNVKEVALCIGHQPIALDEQLTEWQKRLSDLDGCKLFTQPYPLSRIAIEPNDYSSQTVAIRGFGLAMIDSVRGLTQNLGGTFKVLDKVTRQMKYIPSGKEPKIILPFSLDGLPLAPKPINKEIDEWYVPSSLEINAYKSAVKKSILSGSLNSTDFLIHAITPLIVDTYVALKGKAIQHSLTKEELKTAIISWLHNTSFEHELIVSKKLKATEMMRKFVRMATVYEPISLDICIGHVWRHCQPTMYELLSFAPLTDALIAEIIQLDERLKRYTYGPPVDSLQQLIALAAQGILHLDFVDNPKIDLLENGWRFNLNGATSSANIMINSVLDAPQILKVVSPLLKNLIRHPLVEPLHDKLGIRTHKNALIANETESNTISVAVLGRLAKGTLIGVDAIAECFGERSKYWAKSLVKRLS